MRDGVRVVRSVCVLCQPTLRSLCDARPLIGSGDANRCKRCIM